MVCRHVQYTARDIVASANCTCVTQRVTTRTLPPDYHAFLLLHCIRRNVQQRFTWIDTFFREYMRQKRFSLIAAPVTLNFDLVTSNLLCQLLLTWVSLNVLYFFSVFELTDGLSDGRGSAAFEGRISTSYWQRSVNNNDWWCGKHDDVASSKWTPQTPDDANSSRHYKLSGNRQLRWRQRGVLLARWSTTWASLRLLNLRSSKSSSPDL